IQGGPALRPPAASGGAERLARRRRRGWKPVASAVAVLAGASLFCFHTFGIFGRDNELVVEMRLRHLAEMYETAGMADRAVDVLREAVAGCPTRCPQALEQLFAVYVRTGRLADGASYFRTFLADHPGHPDGERYLERPVALEAGLAADSSRHLIAVDSRQPDVDQHHVGHVRPGGLQGGHAVLDDADPVAEQLEQHHQALGGVRVVLDDQEPRRMPLDRRRCRHHLFGTNRKAR